MLRFAWLLFSSYGSLVIAAAPAPKEKPSPYPPLSLQVGFQLTDLHLRGATPISENLYPARSRFEIAALMIQAVWQEAGVDIPAECKQALSDTEASKDLSHWPSFLSTIASCRARLGATKWVDSFVSARALASVFGRFSSFERLSIQERHQPQSMWTKVGVGLHLFPESPTVDHVSLGSPAHLAGLRPRDRVEHPEKILAHLTSDHRTPFKISWWRAGEKKRRTETIRPMSWEREAIVGTRRESGESWSFWASKKPSIAHLRFRYIDDAMVADLDRLLPALIRAGAKGAILDLRFPDANGNTHAAFDFAARFIDPPRITSQTRFARDTFKIPDPSERFLDLPLAVLIGKGTDSGGEIFSALLAQAKRARVFGERTIGNGQLLGDLLHVADGDETWVLRGALAEYFLPEGRSLWRGDKAITDKTWGVLPDVAVPVTPDLNQDIQEQWANLSLRLTVDNEAYDVEHAPGDPARDTALKYLQGRLE